MNESIFVLTSMAVFAVIGMLTGYVHGHGEITGTICGGLGGLILAIVLPAILRTSFMAKRRFTQFMNSKLKIAVAFAFASMFMLGFGFFVGRSSAPRPNYGEIGENETVLVGRWSLRMIERPEFVEDMELRPDRTAITWNSSGEQEFISVWGLHRDIFSIQPIVQPTVSSEPTYFRPIVLLVKELGRDRVQLVSQEDQTIEYEMTRTDAL